MTAPLLAHQRAEAATDELGHHSYVLVKLDRWEVDNPKARRGGALFRPDGDQTLTLGLHLYFSHSGTIAGDWPAIQFQAPPIGRVYVGLHTSGETLVLLQTRVTRNATDHDYFVRIDDNIFCAVSVRRQHKEPVWPWKVVQWADRYSAAQLFDRAVSLWPRRHDGTFGRMLEPVRVTSVHTADPGRFGLGLCPAYVGTDPTQPSYKLRHAEDLAPTLPMRAIDAALSAKPPLLLWGQETSHKDGDASLHARTTSSEEDNTCWEDLSVSQASAWASYRVCLPDPEGSHPPVHIKNLLTSRQAQLQHEQRRRDQWYPQQSPSGAELVMWCPRCMAETETRSRSIAGGFCLQHYEAHVRVHKGLSGLTCPRSPYGTHRWARKGLPVPRCRYCGATDDGGKLDAVSARPATGLEDRGSE